LVSNRVGIVLDFPPFSLAGLAAANFLPEEHLLSAALAK